MDDKMIVESKKSNLFGEQGLPEGYPIPEGFSDMLFYIQRNQNMNTVVYELNRIHDGSVNEAYPMHVFWIRYTENGKLTELNFIQNKLAYGYESIAINHEAFEFNFVSYKKKKFYIGKDNEENYKCYTKINDTLSQLTHVYVFAEELGVFPSVKYIEFYGIDKDSGKKVYEKLIVE